jgi:uncharacterized protein YndB with AHSA1/START domain
MEHVRLYPHPVERVWRAITEAGPVAAWFGPVEFDMRVGGTARFGPAESPWWTTVISRLDPPALIEFSGAMPTPSAGFIRYELTAVGDGCRMVFTQRFDPGDHFEAVPSDLGGDLPGGPDTPWMPGFVGGWHDFFDRLGRTLDDQTATAPSDTPFARLADAAISRLVDNRQISPELGVEIKDVFVSTERWNELNEIYRQHIRVAIPAR